MRGRTSTFYFLLLIPILCAGCDGWQSALDPHTGQSSRLRSLVVLFTLICGFIWLLVMLMLAIALRRRNGNARDPLESDPGAERRAGLAVGSALAATVVVITGLTMASYFVTRSVSASAADPLVIRVRGFQWWWEVTYLDPTPDQVFLSANEIHVPVGQQLRIELVAADVIHSFWVPSLAGKQDMVPGRTNQLTFTADHPGVYRGQCAEFCGLQHAHMAMLVVVEPREAFDAWRTAQVREAVTPADAEQEAGRRVIESRACAACHTVRGTSAAGTTGPDLTHVGSRHSIAAGLLPTTRGALAAWVADPQTIKPGSNMPMVPLSAEELKAVSAYLVALQ
jgi:cytochrome c oxidase subunit 2